jgi:hypothetical protein
MFALRKQSRILDFLPSLHEFPAPRDRPISSPPKNKGQANSKVGTGRFPKNEACINPASVYLGVFARQPDFSGVLSSPASLVSAKTAQNLDISAQLRPKNLLFLAPEFASHPRYHAQA